MELNQLEVIEYSYVAAYSYRLHNVTLVAKLNVRSCICTYVEKNNYVIGLASYTQELFMHNISTGQCELICQPCDVIMKSMASMYRGY